MQGAEWCWPENSNVVVPSIKVEYNLVNLYSKTNHLCHEGLTDMFLTIFSGIMCFASFKQISLNVYHETCSCTLFIMILFLLVVYHDSLLMSFIYHDNLFLLFGYHEDLLFIDHDIIFLLFVYCNTLFMLFVYYDNLFMLFVYLDTALAFHCT